MIVVGEYLAGTTVTLALANGSVSHTLERCEPDTDTRLELSLPTALQEGDYVLTITNQGGDTCSADLRILQGEPGTLDASGAEIIASINTVLESDPLSRVHGMVSGQLISTLQAVGASLATARSVLLNGQELVSDSTPGLFLVVVDLADHTLYDEPVGNFFRTLDVNNSVVSADIADGTITGHDLAPDITIGGSLNVADQFVVTSDGDVGIGTTDPAGHALNVAGTTTISGDTTVGGALLTPGVGRYTQRVDLSQGGTFETAGGWFKVGEVVLRALDEACDLDGTAWISSHDAVGGTAYQHYVSNFSMRVFQSNGMGSVPDGHLFALSHPGASALKAFVVELQPDVAAPPTPGLSRIAVYKYSPVSLAGLWLDVRASCHGAAAFMPATTMQEPAAPGGPFNPDDPDDPAPGTWTTLGVSEVLAGGVLTVGGDLAVHGSISVIGTIDGSDISDHVTDYGNHVATFNSHAANANAHHTPTVDTNTWRSIDNTPVNGVTTESISSNWAYDHTANANAHHTPTVDTNTWRPIDNSPVNGVTAESISSNWAYDHTANASAHHVKTVNTDYCAGGTCAGNLDLNTNYMYARLSCRVVFIDANGEFGSAQSYCAEAGSGYYAVAVSCDATDAPPTSDCAGGDADDRCRYRSMTSSLDDYCGDSSGGDAIVTCCRGT